MLAVNVIHVNSIASRIILEFDVSVFDVSEQGTSISEIQFENGFGFDLPPDSMETSLVCDLFELRSVRFINLNTRIITVTLRADARWNTIQHLVRLILEYHLEDEISFFLMPACR